MKEQIIENKVEEHKTRKKRLKISVLAAMFFLIFLIGVGTILFHIIESWSVIDSLYFATMTITTVGYGDFVPTHDVSKIITIIYAFSGIAIAFYVLFDIGHFMIEHMSFLKIKK